MDSAIPQNGRNCRKTSTRTGAGGRASVSRHTRTKRAMVLALAAGYPVETGRCRHFAELPGVPRSAGLGSSFTTSSGMSNGPAWRAALPAGRQPSHRTERRSRKPS
jgi:hypothetical protein